MYHDRKANTTTKTKSNGQRKKTKVLTASILSFALTRRQEDPILCLQMEKVHDS
jgi:hypothetical protein